MSNTVGGKSVYPTEVDIRTTQQLRSSLRSIHSVLHDDEIFYYALHCLFVAKVLALALSHGSKVRARWAITRSEVRARWAPV
jgi:hypothetical protein